MDKPIKIRHNESGDEGECMPSALPVWEDNGWTAVEDGSSEVAPAVQQVQPQQPVVAAKVQPDPNKSKE